MEALALRWQPCPVPILPALTTLKVGLSGLQVVALALPHLVTLDLNGCSHLRVLELRCPSLHTLSLQACNMLPASALAATLPLCPALALLDVQHVAHLQRPSLSRATSSSLLPGASTGASTSAPGLAAAAAPNPAAAPAAAADQAVAGRSTSGLQVVAQQAAPRPLPGAEGALSSTGALAGQPNALALTLLGPGAVHVRHMLTCSVSCGRCRRGR